MKLQSVLMVGVFLPVEAQLVLCIVVYHTVLQLVYSFISRTHVGVHTMQRAMVQLFWYHSVDSRHQLTLT